MWWADIEVSTESFHRSSRDSRTCYELLLLGHFWKHTWNSVPILWQTELFCIQLHSYYLWFFSVILCQIFGRWNKIISLPKIQKSYNHKSCEGWSGTWCYTLLLGCIYQERIDVPRNTNNYWMNINLFFLFHFQRILEI